MAVCEKCGDELRVEREEYGLAFFCWTCGWRPTRNPSEEEKAPSKGRAKGAYSTKKKPPQGRTRRGKKRQRARKE